MKSITLLLFLALAFASGCSKDAQEKQAEPEPPVITTPPPPGLEKNPARPDTVRPQDS